MVSAIKRVAPHAPVYLAFEVAFVRNGYTLAYGDATAHVPHLHATQLCYAAAFTCKSL